MITDIQVLYGADYTSHYTDSGVAKVNKFRVRPREYLGTWADAPLDFYLNPLRTENEIKKEI
jgi:hypothetical protein